MRGEVECGGGGEGGKRRGGECVCGGGGGGARTIVNTGMTDIIRKMRYAFFAE